MMGRGWAAAQSILRSREHEEKQTADERMVLPVEHITVAPRLSVIEDAHKKASALVEGMEARKRHWQEQIKIATEELRQTEIVLAGAYQLQHTIEAGMPQRPVHDEIDTTVSESISFDELSKLMSSTSGPNWRDQK